MDTLAYETVRPKSWDMAKSYLSQLTSEGGFVFRGQGNARWTLTSSLERVHIGNEYLLVEDLERGLLNEFTRQVHHYVDNSNLFRETVDWLSFMQHHGTPTRLVDFTASPYISAYFALEDASESCAIWAISLPWVNKCSHIALTSTFPKYQHARYPELGGPHVFPDLFTNECMGVFHVQPYYLHQRLKLQQGLFLCPGNVNQTFEQNLLTYQSMRFPRHNMPDYGMKESIVKIELDRSIRPAALRDLELMNITRESLFPGIDGFAQSLKYKYAAMYQESS